MNIELIIGFIAIFTALFVFFSDELLNAVQTIKKRPQVFLMLTLLLMSLLAVCCHGFFSWVVAVLWIGLLYLREWVEHSLLLTNTALTRWLAKLLIMLLFTLGPILSARGYILWKKPVKPQAALRRHSYEISVILGIVIWALMSDIVLI